MLYNYLIVIGGTLILFIFFGLGVYLIKLKLRRWIFGESNIDDVSNYIFFRSASSLWHMVGGGPAGRTKDVVILCWKWDIDVIE